MKSKIFLLVFLLFIATFSFVKAQNNSEREVKLLERAWLDAYEKHDSKAMDEIVADDFTITFPDGSIQTKPQILASLKQARSGSPPLKFYTEDVQARVYGDTVILIGRVITEWKQKDQLMKETNRYTDTYVKRGGRWQVVASHLSNVPKPQNKEVSLQNSPLRIDFDEQLQNVGVLNFLSKKPRF